MLGKKGEICQKLLMISSKKQSGLLLYTMVLETTSSGCKKIPTGVWRRVPDIREKNSKAWGYYVRKQ